MDLNELRKQVITPAVEIHSRLRAKVGGFLAAALICSLATAFTPSPEWPAAGAILFLVLGLFCGRTLERRAF